MFKTVSVAWVLVVAAACGGRYKGAEGPRPDAMPKGGLDAAALPYQILERKGTQVEEPAFWDRVAQARAVCVGEEHPNPHHHWVQLHVVRTLGKRLGKDQKFAVGLEMIQRPFQGPLDDYSAKKIDATTLQSRAGWADRWGYNWDFYAPTFDAAIAAGGRLLALNTPRELTKKVVRQGLESLTPDEKAQMPELKLDDQAHRAWFDNLMSGMGGANVHSKKDENSGNDGNDDDDPHKDVDKEKVPNPHKGGGGAAAMPDPERIYTAQVLWDETMADGSVRWLKENPNGHLVILAGNGHCHDSAIVGRMKRRGVADVLSIRVVIDDGEGDVAEVLAKPMNDYVMVLQLPKQPAGQMASSGARPAHSSHPAKK